MSDNWICRSLVLDERGSFFLKSSRTTCVLRFSDPTIFCNFPTVILGFFGHSNSPHRHPLGHYRHMSSSRQICNIFSWLEILNYCLDDGNLDFQCFSPFLTATFYFVKLKNLVLPVRTIFLGFTPCDGWLRECNLCVLHIYNSVKQEVMAGQFHAPSQPGVLKM